MLRGVAGGGVTLLLLRRDLTHVDVRTYHPGLVEGLLVESRCDLITSVCYVSVVHSAFKLRDIVLELSPAEVVVVRPKVDVAPAPLWVPLCRVFDRLVELKDPVDAGPHIGLFIHGIQLLLCLLVAR